MQSVEVPVSIDTLDRWFRDDGTATTTSTSDDPLSSATAPPASTSPFPFSPSSAAKIVLWQGNLVRLEADAIVNSTNESLSDRSGLCGDIFRCAGPELAVEVAKLEGCRTGESKPTKGYSLPARYVIHTVGPRYNVKYKTAAENALHSCYRSCLQVAVEHDLRSIAFCVVNSLKRGYPREDGAHIALRTVRRFLDRFGQKIETVVFAVENESDFDIYNRVLQLYFPRSLQEEAAALSQLPEDLGNEMGETVIEERKIRINPFPTAADEIERPPMTIDESEIRGFATAMEGDPDQKRIQAQAKKTPKQIEDEETDRMYSACLRRIQQEDLTDIARRNVIFQSGSDSAGRPIFVLVGMNMPMYTDEVTLERILLYSIKILDPVATRREFVFVYLHANTPTERQPEMAYMRKLYRFWNRKYTAQMTQMFLVHPTFWFKVALGIMKPFMEDAFVDKLRYIDRLPELFEFIDHEQLKIPEEIYRYDHIENGIPYRPEESAANEGL